MNYKYQYDKDCERVSNQYSQVANDYTEASNTTKSNELLDRAALACEQESILWTIDDPITFSAYSYIAAN